MGPSRQNIFIVWERGQVYLLFISNLSYIPVFVLAQRKNPERKIIPQTKKMGRKNRRNLKKGGNRKNVGKNGSSPRLKKLGKLKHPPMRLVKKPLSTMTKWAWQLMSSPAQAALVGVAAIKRKLLTQFTNPFILMKNYQTSPKIQMRQIWI